MQSETVGGVFSHTKALDRSGLSGQGEDSMKQKRKLTDAVLAANRTNAKRSTGPKTPDGKSTVSRNALRHGLLSRRIHLDTDQDRREYQELLGSWTGHFRPRGPLEEFLVDEI